MGKENHQSDLQIIQSDCIICYSCINYIEKAKHWNLFQTENNHAGKPNIARWRQVLGKEDLIYAGQDISFCFQPCVTLLPKLPSLLAVRIKHHEELNIMNNIGNKSNSLNKENILCIRKENLRFKIFFFFLKKVALLISVG